MRKIILLLFCLIPLTIFAQTLVKGKVVDTQGQPLIGATVLVENTTVGTVTDLEGLFEIQVPAGENTLTVSSLGYGTTSVSIDGRTYLDISMEEENATLEEVVVSALGFQTKKDRSGTASSNVNANAIRS